MKKMTEENLKNAFAGESQAHIKYLAFADKAERENFSNIARPRLDAARFMWKDIPTLSFSVYGSKSYYHLPADDISMITPEILEDLAQLVFLAVLDMASQESLEFR